MDTLKLFRIRMFLAARALHDREDGQAMVEYALILALVATAAVAILSTVGGQISNIFVTVNSDL
jgi:Flp pilus assembly pilin Flp